MGARTSLTLGITENLKEMVGQSKNNRIVTWARLVLAWPLESKRTLEQMLIVFFVPPRVEEHASAHAEVERHT